MNTTSFISSEPLPKFSLWDKLDDQRVPLSFILEITARCNNGCRHCYINLPASDKDAKRKELTLDEINNIADQAVGMGALWCLISGGEPFLRKDFADIYLALRKKGLLISIFSNACLVNEEHVELLLKYPAREIEISVYGVTEETYERVTRRSGSYAAFRRGLSLLLDNGIKVRLKAMALRSNVEELPAIAEFCRKYTTDYYRFDPLLHLRHDADPRRNKAIQAERLLPEKIVVIEQADDERSRALEKGCEKLISPERNNNQCDHLFNCGVGNKSFVVSYDGIFRLCADLWHPDCIADLRQTSLAKAWDELAHHVRGFRSKNPEFLKHCRQCPIVNLCMWCPALAYLETGELDGFSAYFCQVAHARVEAIDKSRKSVAASEQLLGPDK